VGVLLLGAWNRPAAAAAPDAGQDLTLTARELSDQALRQYQQEEFDAAIESFMGAFALSNNPGLLFNVAQAYRLKGDCEHARDYYQRYLGAVPETPIKESLERRVAEMDACLKSASAKSGVRPGDTTRSIDAGAATTTARPAPPTSQLASPGPGASPARRTVVWTLRGSAVALLASSAVFGALAWGAHRDIESAPTMRAAWDANDRYKTDTALTWTFAASGVACAVVSYFVGRHR
jgi:tetratricopeptide (TPR) repeat protein